MFDFTLEIGAGYTGLLGRQLTLSPATVQTPAQRADVLAQVQVFEQAAEEGGINALGFMHQFFFGQLVGVRGSVRYGDRSLGPERGNHGHPSDGPVHRPPCSSTDSAAPSPSTTRPSRGDPHNATMTLALAGLALGTHMLQVHPDRGWVRNEAPLVAQP